MIFAVSALQALEPVWSFSHFAGSTGGGGDEDGASTVAKFGNPTGVAVDDAGNIYVADATNQTIRKITSGGVVSIFAGGNGEAGDVDGQGTNARFNSPNGLWLTKAGVLYVATNSGVRKVTSDASVTTVSNTSACDAVAVDGDGNIYTVSFNSTRLSKRSPEGVVTYYGGDYGSVDGSAATARFTNMPGVAVDSDGTVYVADYGSFTIRKITKEGTVSTLAGTAGQHGSVDGVGAAASFIGPWGVAVDEEKNVYVSDGYNTMRKITPAGVVSTVAGSFGGSGYADGVGAAARFYGLMGLAVDRVGNIVVADAWNFAIRSITPTAVVTTVAGLPSQAGSVDGATTTARFSFPSGVAFDPAGNLYVADTNNHTLRKITTAGVVTTYAGTAGQSGSSDGVGNAARFNFPSGVAVDSEGAIYVVDTSNYTIRKVDPSGAVTTLAGRPGIPGKQDGPAAEATFYAPQALAVDAAKNVYVMDTGNYAVRKITPAGVVSTLAGAGTNGLVDGTGTAAKFGYAEGIAVDGAGNVYVADSNNAAIRKITPAGEVTTLTTAWFHCDGVTVDSGGTLYVVGPNKVQRITPAGVVSTVAGDSYAGSSDAPGTVARFNGPRGIAVDSHGDLYVADTRNHAIRKGKLSYGPTITWPTPGAISYGTLLSATQLNATADVSGSFAYSLPVGTLLPVGTHTVSAVFTPSSPADYAAAKAQVTLTVTKATPTITWSQPSPIPYGTALSGAQLNATASVPGQLSYSYPGGTLLPGTYTLTAWFTPDDSTNYTLATAQTTLTVYSVQTPTISWAQPAAITYGTALSATQLNATASVPGTLSYSPAAGEVLAAGAHQLTVSFTPSDSTNYASVSAQVNLTVNKAKPTLTWVTPAAITYGTPLSATQLAGSGSVPGTFSYNPSAGTLLHAGAAQSLSATFTPQDSDNYATSTVTTTITVGKAPLVVTADNKSKLQRSDNPVLTATYSGFIGNDGLANLDTAPLLSTTADSSSPMGTYPITVTGGADDDYTYVLHDGTLTVTAAAVAPIITSAASTSTAVWQPVHFVVTATGTPSPTFSAQGLPPWASLDANTGVLSGNPPTANGAPFVVTITASNGTQPSATQTFTLSVEKGASVVAWTPQGSPLTYGTPLTASQLNASANVPGTITYSPALGTVLNAGVAQTLTATFVPYDLVNYTRISISTVISVSKAPLTAQAADKAKVQGASNPSLTISYTGFVNGDTAAVIDTAPTASTGATASSPLGTYPIILTGGSDNNYALTLQNGTLTIAALLLAPTITSANSGAFSVGRAGSFSVTATGTPAPTFSATGVPAWASFDAATGVLSGTPDGSASAYTMVFTASNGTAPDATQSFTLNITAATVAPAFSTQPTSRTVAVGASTSFSVTATGLPEPTYQWQLSVDGGANWTNVVNEGGYAGATTATLNISGATLAMNGYRYRCVATNSLGNSSSATAALAVTATGTNDLAGTYFGTFGSDHGRWALSVNADNTALFIGYLSSRSSAIVLTLTIGADGTFSTTGTELLAASAGAATARGLSLGTSSAEGLTATGFTFSGRIVGNALTGELSGLAETLSGTADRASGGAAAGVYQAVALNAASGESHAIVAASGQAMVVLVSSTSVDGATGTVTTGGVTNLTTLKGGALAMNVSAAGTLAATLTPTGSTTAVSFAGLADGVASTSRAVNIASRAYCGKDNAVTIGGFVVSGSVKKRVLVRAVGPSLTAHGLAASEVLADPTIEVHDFSHGNTTLTTNDNWGDNANATEITATAKTVGASELLASDTASAGALLELDPGVYTFVVKGKNDTVGIVLLEVYDADATSTGTTFTNIATRAYATTGNGVAIGGFVVNGNAPKRVLLRAVGPTLATQGLNVNEVLADPAIELHDALNDNAKIAANDDWGTNANAASITTTGARIGATPIDQSDTKSAALLLNLQPGVYTFIASGNAAAPSGIVLVEVYDAD